MSKARLDWIKRKLSLFARAVTTPFKERRTFRTLQQWRAEQNVLPVYYPVRNKILIIRLDEIGDYLLWRNSLSVYKSSLRWKDGRITLLGNKVWKEIFEHTDSNMADEVIWVDKKRYSEPDYRRELWIRLRGEGFETVICPSRTRTPLLDDACAMATGAKNMFASKNIYFKGAGNKISDAFYQHLYQSKQEKHDFFSNQDFASWCCHTDCSFKRPLLDSFLFRQPTDNDYIICFIGASRKSNQIPVKTWIQLLELLQQQYPSRIILAGGPSDKAAAAQITSAIPVTSIVGKTSLRNMIDYTAFANAVITGDTMAAHLAVSCQTPVLIISNGIDFIRFAGYKEAGIPNAETVYAKPFLEERKKKKTQQMSGYVAVTNDISTIDACDILKALDNVYPSAIMKIINDV